MPKNGELYCKACKKAFTLDLSEVSSFKIVKKLNHGEEHLAPIIVRSSSIRKISSEDRKAYEELFRIDG